MFPWVYGFEWNPGYLIFLGVFFTVAVVVAGTLIAALWRSFRAVQKKQEGRVYWHEAFEELTPEERLCRHALTGELPERCCDHEFDCRGCRMHARLLYSEDAAGSTGAGQAEVCGLAVPMDRYYHRGHTWVREEQDGTLVIGLDDLGRRLLGGAGVVETPPAGTELRVNEPAFAARRNGVEVRILSPVDGTVTGPDADGGGLVRVRPAERFQTAHLLRGGEAAAWMRHELDRLQMSLAAACGSATLADGGVVAEDLGRCLPRREFDTACGLAFLDV